MVATVVAAVVVDVVTPDAAAAVLQTLRLVAWLLTPESESVSYRWNSAYLPVCAAEKVSSAVAGAMPSGIRIVISPPPASCSCFNVSVSHITRVPAF